ncbi:MAG TPA: hypothetical protein VG692_15675 [Gemmatimonadales bacterium]|nr:hypothetical protein [Gemmatimonadales bacterium]
MSFLWMSDEVAAQFFRDVSQLEYTAENQRRNDFRSRDSWEMRLFDAWGHCFMGAAATRDLGEPGAWFLGGGSEVLHEGLSWLTIGLLGHDSIQQDTYNQAVGRSLGTRHPTGDLGPLCFTAMIDGRLDLTLAGIPRGTHLHRVPVAAAAARPVRPRIEEWRRRRGTSA